MAILPREQITQRHPRATVAAQGVTLWESATSLATRVVTNDDVVVALDVEIAHMPVYEDQGGDTFMMDGFTREGDFGDGFFGYGVFGDAEDET
jgi:hypothetical protein